MSHQDNCSINCAVKHSADSNCEFRNIQCPFVSCSEKISFHNLNDHLWVSHKLLQFPNYKHSAEFNIGPKTFVQNYAARPWSLSFEEKQFVFEACRKNDTGLWHFWVFLVGSTSEARSFQYQIKLFGDQGGNYQELIYTGNTISVDVTFNDIFRRQDALVLPDGVVKRFVNMSSMSVSYEVELKQIKTPTTVYNDENLSSSMRNLGLSSSSDMFNLNQGMRSPAFGAMDEPEPPSTSMNGGGAKTPIGFQTKYGKMIYPDTHKLFVGNLFDECRDELLSIFGSYGTIVDILFFKNNLPSPKSTYYAFVIFKDEWSVTLCMSDRPICARDGRQLTVLTKANDHQNVKPGFVESLNVASLESSYNKKL